MFTRVNTILAILSILIVTYSSNGQASLESEVDNQNVDIQVEQGLSILGKNEFGMSYAHALRPFRFSVPTYETEIERFKIAIDKFQVALLHKDKLRKYKPLQIHSFLAVANCRLATAYEVSSTGNLGYDLDKRIAYGACFAEYERVIKESPTILIAIEAENYIAAIIESKNFELALDKINEIRMFTKNKTVSINNLFYFEGDIYYKLGDKKMAGMAYEKWLLSKPDTLGISEEIINKLKVLNKETGLPTLKSLANIN